MGQGDGQGPTGEAPRPWKESVFCSNGCGKPPREDHSGDYIETSCRIAKMVTLGSQKSFETIPARKDSEELPWWSSG